MLKLFRTLGTISLFSRSCRISLWRLSCRSIKETLWVKEGFFRSTVNDGAARPVLHPPGPIPKLLVLATEASEEDIVEEEGPERSVWALPAMKPCPVAEELREEMLGAPPGPPEDLISVPAPIAPILIPPIVESDDDDHPALNISGAGEMTVEMESELDDALMCECVLFSLSSEERLLSRPALRINGLNGDDERDDGASGAGGLEPDAKSWW